MSRSNLILLGLLVVTNAAWLVLDREPPPAPDRGPRAPPRSEAIPAEPPAGTTSVRSSNTSPPALRPGESAASPPSPAPPDLRAGWIREAMQIRDPGRRSRALEEIRSALLDPDPARTAAALEALFVIADDDELTGRDWHALLLPHLRSEDPRVLVAALRALFCVDRADGDVALLEKLARHPSAAVRRLAAEHLSGFPAVRDSADPLLALLDDPDPGVAVEAIQGLSHSRDGRTPERLLELVRHGGRPLRLEALAVLVQRFARTEGLLPELLRALDEPDRELRDRAFALAYEYGRRLGRDALADAAAEILERSERPGAPEAAAGLLERFGSERHVPALERYARNPLVRSWRRRKALQTIELIRKRSR